MKKLSFLFLVLLLAFQNCTRDCGESFTPSSPLTFIVVDKNTLENLFTNGTFDPDKIKIVNTLNDNQLLEFRFIKENNRNLIEIGSIGWKTETVHALVKVGEVELFNLQVETERKEGECNSYTEYKTISVLNADYQVNPQTGVYTILIE